MDILQWFTHQSFVEVDGKSCKKAVNLSNELHVPVVHQIPLSGSLPGVTKCLMLIVKLA